MARPTFQTHKPPQEGRRKKAAALTFLEQTIERSLPLFRTDPAIFESRRTAWLIRTHLLLEWNRPAEALAWTCLECQLSTESPDARALRDRLLRQLNLDFDPPKSAPDNIAIETQWPGVAGMYELKAKLERDIILSLSFPDEARRYGVPLPNGILLYGPPGRISFYRAIQELSEGCRKIFCLHVGIRRFSSK